MSALVLVPAFTPPLPEDAHLTLVWPGDVAEPQAAARLAVMVQMFSQQYPAFAARVMGVNMFGTNHDEPVLIVQPTSEIMIMRAAVAPYSKSEHTEFRPHVAVPSIGQLRWSKTKLPKLLYFNRVAYWPRDDGPGDETTAFFCGG